jgi:hypothetical protein
LSLTSDVEDTDVVLERFETLNLEHNVLGCDLLALTGGVFRLDGDLADLDRVLVRGLLLCGGAVWRVWGQWLPVAASAVRVVVSASVGLVLGEVLLNLGGHLVDVQVGQLRVVRHEILDGVIHLVSCLDDHVVDVHVGSDAVGLVKRGINQSLGLVSLEGRLLSRGSFLRLCPQEVLLLLCKIYDLDAGHLHLDVRLQALDVFDSLDKLSLVISRQSDVHGFLVGLVLDEFVESSV